MKIAIVSDIHDNWANLEQFSLQIREQDDVKNVIVCGDISAPGTLRKLSESLPQKNIYAVAGNVDGDIAGHKRISSEVNNVTFFEKIGEIVLGGKKIAFTHKPDEAKSLAQKGSYDIVFYGHTHKAWEEKIGKTVILNPGELTYFFYTPTYCIYDLEKMRGKLILLYK